MADELDSGSSVGNYVWVQVPSPAFTDKKNPLFCKDSFFVHIHFCTPHHKQTLSRLIPPLLPSQDFAVYPHRILYPMKHNTPTVAMPPLPEIP